MSRPVTATPAFRGCAAVVIALALVAACSGNEPSSNPASSTTRTEHPTTTEPPAALVVRDTSFMPVTFEHWEGGVSYVDEGYSWGAVIDNPTDEAAVDVEVVVSFERDSEVLRSAVFVVDEIPPGEFAFGSKPLIVWDSTGAPAEVDAVTVTVDPARVEPARGERDVLASAAQVPLADWDGRLVVEAVDDPRPLVVFVAYYDTSGELVAVEPSPIDTSQLQPGAATEVFVAARPEGGPSGLADVEVFLARVADADVVMSPERSASFTPRPPQVDAAAVATARERWESTAPERYVWTVALSYFAEEPTLRMTVDGTEVTDTQIVATGIPGYSSALVAEDAVSVDGLFDQMEDAFRRGNTVYAEFDPTGGYPVAADFTSPLPDSGVSYRVVRFKPTTADGPSEPRGLCEAAQDLADAADAAVAAATSSHNSQVTAQEAWRSALDDLRLLVTDQSVVDAIAVLMGAEMTVSDEPWTPGQQQASQVLWSHLEAECPVVAPTTSTTAS